MNYALTVSNFAIGVFLILFGILLGRITNNVLKSFLSRFNINKLLSNITNFDVKLEEAIALILSFVVAFIFIALGLNIIGIATVIINIISGFIFVLIIIFLFLSIKDFLPNLTAGIYILSKRNVCEGKFVRVKDVSGQIEHIDLLETKLKTKNGETIIIPNSQFVRNAIFILNEPEKDLNKKNASKKSK